MGEAETGSRSRRRPGATARARKLRQGSNQAEALLWLELKRRKLGGYRFTRQLPIGPYFADFACRDRRLVVELDGSQHADNSYDRRRDAFMQNEGWSVLRFWSHHGVSRRTAVCDTILAALDGRLRENVITPDMRFVHGSRRTPDAADPLTLGQRVGLPIFSDSTSPLPEPSP